MTLDDPTRARVERFAARHEVTVRRAFGSVAGRMLERESFPTLTEGGAEALVAVDRALERWRLDDCALVARVALAPDARPVVHVVDTPDGPACIDRDGNVPGAPGAADARPRDPRTTVMPVRGTARLVCVDDVDTRWLVRVDTGARWPCPEGKVELAADAEGRVLLTLEGATVRALTLDADGALTPFAAAVETGDQAVTDVALHAPSRTLAVVSAVGLRVGPLDDFARAKTVARASHDLRVAGFSDGGETLVLHTRERLLRVRLRDRATVVATLPADRLHQVALDPASGRCLVLDRHGALHVVDGDAVRSVASSASVARAAAVSADGALLAAVYDDGSLRVFERASGEVVSLTEWAAPLRALAFTPDGRELVGLDEAGNLARWSARDGELVLTHAIGRPGLVPARCVLSADGQWAMVLQCRREGVASPGGLRAKPGVLERVSLASGACAWSTSFDGRRLAFDVAPEADGLHLAVLAGDLATVSVERVRCADGERVASSRVPTPAPWMHLSPDGATVWSVARAMPGRTTLTCSTVGEARVVERAVATLDGDPTGFCAGRRVALVHDGAGRPALVNDAGRVQETALDRFVAPLGFVDDDATLLVADRASLVLELAVPEAGEVEGASRGGAGRGRRQRRR